ncbi:MAG: lamin tail domain-containing protein [Bacteroidota bacterium]|nr:lamin tail domain-containing protein [Bacteroidota bacterium]
MIRNFLFCFCIFIFYTPAKAQLSENFNDGDFINNPAWVGGTQDFLVNASMQLQSNSTVVSSTYYISTANTLANNAEWNFYVQIGFNPSSANYIDVYLIASASDLTANSTTGYFVRIGNTNDEICLYRKDNGGVVTKIIDGADDILNKSSNVMNIKVVRDASNQWILSRDLSGTGRSYTAEGAVTDATYTSTSFFGFLVKQSTSSFFQKHFFDDIEIKPYAPDVIPPTIVSATAVGLMAVDVLFSEPVELSSSQLIANYSANNGLRMPVSATIDATNPSLIHLTFTTSFTNYLAYTLSINNVKDLAGNAISNGSAGFSFYTPQQYDIVIDEIMADPTPQVGLPNNEWIELKNTSAFPINLQGWRLADLSGQTSPMPNFILKPDSFVIVCTGSAVPALSSFGNTISVTSFPSLGNDGDQLSLTSATGKTIHAVQYSSSWYKNDLKKDGGWTLEMIDTKNACSGISNWKASTDAAGGTPGKKNSVDAVNADVSAPKLLRAFATSSSTITLVYDEPLDSLSAATVSNYKFDNGLSASGAITISPVFDKVNLQLTSPLTPGTVYNVVTTNVTDCQGNAISSGNNARFGLSQEADSFDIVINEILFNPKPEGADYVELYNRSQKIIDLSHLYIANRNSSNAISSIQQVTTESVLLFPKDFIVLTADEAAVKNQYITTNPDAFISVSSMPSFSDDKGDVIILNNQGNIVDEVKYSDKWHFPLVTNTEGVSLERIDYDGQSVQSNFHSASTSSGYGTPGYKNSQYRLDEEVQGTITATPDIFSADNDGTDDFATINYSFPSAGYVANVTIFDA